MLPHKNPKPPAWYFSRGGVILLLIIFGPLAFPFLWKTSMFSKKAKFVLTVVFILFTIGVTIHAIHMASEIFSEFRRLGLIR